MGRRDEAVLESLDWPRQLDAQGGRGEGVTGATGTVILAGVILFAAWLSGRMLGRSKDHGVYFGLAAMAPPALATPFVSYMYGIPHPDDL